ncbi:MAG: 2-C-methyl-D-erythritol 4-phosphate cytidylyltransferase [Candidatus Hydrogenedentes bacterium]|nr:2-C-methyl-D-erythritol 4-phosphate cytidylyltransferase [Candidatus Hydrogenedentota bacterium]
MKSQLLIPAAGMGVRLGCQGPKAMALLAGEPLLVRTLKRFQPVKLVEGAVIVAPPGTIPMFCETLTAYFPGMDFEFSEGGSERQISVGNGLDRIDSATELVLIHDAARPFVDDGSIRACQEAAAAWGAATVAVPCVDTILEADADRSLIKTPDRQALWSCQTPQTFQVSVIREAYAQARASNYVATDDATLVRRTGKKVMIVPGTALNFKVTTPVDLALAELIIEKGWT